MIGWTNLLHNQNSYLLKKVIKIWKLQLVYTDFLHISSMSLMAHLEFFNFSKNLSKKIIKYFFLQYDIDLWKNVLD
jgi:hypothetical protein